MGITRRNFTRELKEAEQDGHLIVCSLAPWGGFPAHHTPRWPSDPKPWTSPAAVFDGRPVRFSGRECHAVKIPTTAADVDSAVYVEAAAHEPVTLHGAPWGVALTDDGEGVLHCPDTDGWTTYNIPAVPGSAHPSLRRPRAAVSGMSRCGTALLPCDETRLGRGYCRDCTAPGDRITRRPTAD